MGRVANMSLLGLLQWDDTLFDLLVVPTALNKENLINNLLAETAELEVLYPNPTVLKNLIGIWSNKQLDVWNRLFATTQYEYNPIENYNRHEEGSTEGGTTETHSGSDTRTISEVTGGRDTTNATGKTGHWVAGYDAPTPTAQNDGLFKQSRDEGEGETTIAYGGTKGTTDALAHGERVATTNEGEHELHAHGNIGVTTTQKLIREQRDIERFNLYDIIIEDFKMRFCILVY